jgi:hypothetical protein
MGMKYIPQPNPCSKSFKQKPVTSPVCGESILRTLKIPNPNKIRAMISDRRSWANRRMVLDVLRFLERLVDRRVPRLLDLLLVVFFDRELLLRPEEVEVFLFVTE